MADDNDEVLQRLTRIETLITQHAALCPYREDIARGANNIKRLAALEETVTTARLEIARLVALSAGGGATVVGVLGVIAKIAGWI